MSIPKISIRQLVDARFLTTLLVVVMCIQFAPLEGYGISPVKVGVMGLSVLIFLLKVPYFSKALIWGLLYWAVCYFGASFQNYMRFSTIGYLGMFIISYTAYYNLVYTGAFSFPYFVRLLRRLIIVYGVMLVLQQIAMILGLYSFAPLNLTSQHFLSLTKLPSLSLEPSHSAKYSNAHNPSLVNAKRPTSRLSYITSICLILFIFLTSFTDNILFV